MNKQEYLLTVLAEEAAEVIQAVAKVQRFGSPDGQNLHQLIKEIYDFCTIVEMIEEERMLYHILPSPDEQREMIDLKKEKVEYYMKESIKLGCLDAE